MVYRIILILILISWPSFKPAPAAGTLVRYEASHNAMGTVFTVAAYGRDGDYLGEVAEEVFEEVDRLDAQMSNYKPASELSVINREAGRREVVVEPGLFQLLRDSVRYGEETGGAFDPTVGPLIRRWGFFGGHGRLPSRQEIAQVLMSIGYRHLKLDEARRTIRFDQNGLELDLGGIAKGYAVDRAVEILRSNSITAALVSSGTSSIYALGSPPGERGWRVTVRDPLDARKPADVFRLQNYSLSTSGSYEKFFKIGGKTYCHIVDPRTGWPVQNMLATVALAPSATRSDALSTSFFVLGVESSRKYLASHPDLMIVFYQPASKEQIYKRVVLRSDVYQLAADEMAEVGK
jgi:thiamine biosynthesis lipoprotein